MSTNSRRVASMLEQNKMNEYKTGYVGVPSSFTTIRALSPEEAAKELFLGDPRDNTIYVSISIFSEKAIRVDELEKIYPELREHTCKFERLESEDDDLVELSILDELKHFFLFTNFGKRVGISVLMIVAFVLYEMYKR